MVDEEAFDEDEAYTEWHDGVLRADSPADRAMCKSGFGGRAKMSLYVRINSWDK